MPKILPQFHLLFSSYTQLLKLSYLLTQDLQKKYYFCYIRCKPLNHFDHVFLALTFEILNFIKEKKCFISGTEFRNLCPLKPVFRNILFSFYEISRESVSQDSRYGQYFQNFKQSETNILHFLRNSFPVGKTFNYHKRIECNMFSFYVFILSFKIHQKKERKIKKK